MAGAHAHHEASKKAGQCFLLRLVMQHGPQGTARVLRALAEKLDGLARLRC